MIPLGNNILMKTFHVKNYYFLMFCDMWQKSTVETVTLTFSKFSELFIGTCNNAQIWQKYEFFGVNSVLPYF